jgi:hypothetical protein
LTFIVRQCFDGGCKLLLAECITVPPPMNRLLQASEREGIDLGSAHVGWKRADCRAAVVFSGVIFLDGVVHYFYELGFDTWSELKLQAPSDSKSWDM